MSKILKYKSNDNKDTVQVNGDSRIISSLYYSAGSCFQNGNGCHMQHHSHDDDFISLHLGTNKTTIE